MTFQIPEIYLLLFSAVLGTFLVALCVLIVLRNSWRAHCETACAAIERRWEQWSKSEWDRQRQLRDSFRNADHSWVRRLTENNLQSANLVNEMLAQKSKQERGVKNRAEALRLLVFTERNFLDPEYREHFAQVHADEIVRTLKKKWADEYFKMMQDPDLVKELRDTHPHVLDWFEVRTDIVLRAERHLVIRLPEPEPERKKLTTEEFREKMIRRDQVQMEDEEARAQLELDRRKKILDDRDREIKETEERTDLTDEQKTDRINVIRELAEMRLQGGTNDTDDSKLL